MKQYTNTYRITISDEMKCQLDLLKSKFSIKPTSFIRIAIQDKITKDTPILIKKLRKSEIPF